MGGILGRTFSKCLSVINRDTSPLGTTHFFLVISQ